MSIHEQAHLDKGHSYKPSWIECSEFKAPLCKKTVLGSEGLSRARK